MTPVVEEIYECRCPFLEVLVLKDDIIESVELLSRVDLPSLKILDLSNNYIIFLKSLRKANCPNLETLNLVNRDGFYNEVEPCEVRYEDLIQLEAGKLENIYFVSDTDASFFAKFQNDEILDEESLDHLESTQAHLLNALLRKARSYSDSF